MSCIGQVLPEEIQVSEYCAHIIILIIILMLLTSRTNIQDLESGQSEDTGRGTAPVYDSAPVTPGTSAQSTSVNPTVMDNNALEPTETDSGMCHHDRFAVRLSAIEINEKL